MKTNKIQKIGEFKTQRKRRTEAIALSQLTASKIPHSKSSFCMSRPAWSRPRPKKG